MSVNTKAVEKWVEYLRSGRFEQTTSVLESVDEEGQPEGYCCLGVACLVARDLGLPLKSTIREGSRYYAEPYSNERAVNNTSLPQHVAEFFGFENDDHSDGTDPRLEAVDQDGQAYQEEASVLNDTQGASFEEIANAIERTYLS